MSTGEEKQPKTTLDTLSTVSVVGYNRINTTFANMYYYKNHCMSSVVCCVCVQICRESWKWEKNVNWRKRLVESVYVDKDRTTLECSQYIIDGCHVCDMYHICCQGTRRCIYDRLQTYMCDCKNSYCGWEHVFQTGVKKQHIFNIRLREVDFRRQVLISLVMREHRKY